MSGSSDLMQSQPTVDIWEGLRQFGVLPDWLAAARDPDRVQEVLSRVVPEFANGKMILERCEIGHMRYKIGSWSGTYELAVRETPDADIRIIPVQGMIYPPESPVNDPIQPQVSFGMEGWKVFLSELNLSLATPEPDKVLFSLKLLTDPELSCRYLEKIIRNGSSSYHDLSMTSCSPKIVRYKPGSRCTILYYPEYPFKRNGDDAWPDLIVAKTYRNEKGQNAYNSMRSLWDSPLGSNPAVTIAEPLAYDPELRVLLQGPIREERTLKELIALSLSAGTPEALDTLESMMRKTAAGLAALHSSGVTTGRTWTWEHELNEVQDRINRLSDSIPRIAHSADPLLSKLKSLDASTPLDPIVPSHGSYRPAQVLIHQGRIGFIDFDSFCQSEPSLDLALFLSTVKSIGLDTSELEGDKSAAPLEEPARTARLNQMYDLCEAFLEEYEKTLPVSRERLALWEALDLMMLVLHGWIKIKTFRLQDCLFLLENHLRRMGV